MNSSYWPRDVPKPGTVIAGKYRVDSLLGVGGTGAVLSTWHEHLRRHVAIKWMTFDAFSDSTSRDHFVREARIASDLASEHIVRILDVDFTPEGHPFIVLEHLDGHDLRHVLDKEKRFSLRTAADYLVQTSEALAVAHSRGIVHRDLKPSNLILVRGHGGRPHIKVLDFGLAKALENSIHREQTTLSDGKSMLGVAHYISPEQAQDSADVDARSDIWTLGVMLYEFLSGRKPFDGNNIPAICLKIAMEDPPPILDGAPQTPPEIVKLIQSCLAKDRRDRVPSVLEFCEALAPFAPSHRRGAVPRIRTIFSRQSDGAPSSLLDRPTDRPEKPSILGRIRSFFR